MFQKLLDSVSDTIDRAKGSVEFVRVFEAAIADMQLSPTEIAALRTIVTDHGLTADDVRFHGEQVLKNAITRAKVDGMVTDAEQKTLDDIIALTQIPPQTAGGLLAQLALQRKMYALSRGVITPIANPGIQLRAGENVYWATPVGQYEERVVRRETVGRSSGVSFRIARGVSYRVGGSRGQSVPVTAMVEIARGNLVITDARVVFLGDRQTVAIDLDDIVGMNPYTNAIVIHTQKRKQPVQFTYRNPDEAEFVAQVLAYALR